MKRVYINIIAVLLIISNVAFAEMYKWTDENGTVHFSDDPPTDPKYNSSVIQSGAGIQSPAKAINRPKSKIDAVTVSIPDVEMVYFDIVGSTLKELWNEMARLGPIGQHFNANQRGFAAVSWSIRWKLPSDKKGDCDPATAKVDLKIKAIFPCWKPSPDTSDALIEKWNHYMAYVEEHEMGHVNIARQGVKDVLEAIKSGDCYFAERRAKDAYARVKQQQDLYDRAEYKVEAARAKFGYWDDDKK